MKNNQFDKKPLLTNDKQPIRNRNRVRKIGANDYEQEQSPPLNKGAKKNYDSIITADFQGDTNEKYNTLERSKSAFGGNLDQINVNETSSNNRQLSKSRSEFDVKQNYSE